MDSLQNVKIQDSKDAERGFVVFCSFWHLFPA